MTHRGAAQVALFAMFLQAMIPLSAAIPLPGEDGARDGQSLPNFYLVICTAYGADTQVGLDGEPLDKVPNNATPWDCPVCQLQASVQGLVPPSPQVAFLAPPLPPEPKTPADSDIRTPLWTAAPGLARAPPAA
ncbi:DUF2946 family protein [Magnetovibrio sp. PR-2]|uniref:DUF2946 family protein n=1 Tax=Magnetovibrio sp. PR-2 TaxID=3120356 RepID=UPI002FCE13FD